MPRILCRLLQRKCFQHRINSLRPSCWDSRPHNSQGSVASLPPAFTLVIWHCSWGQGQCDRGGVWFSCLEFCPTSLTWLSWFSVLWGYRRHKSKEVAASKQRGSSALCPVSRQRLCLPTGRKKKGTWSHSQRRKQSQQGALITSSPTTDQFCVWVHFSFAYFMKKISN